MRLYLLVLVYLAALEYTNCKELVRALADEIGLDVDKEYDLIGLPEAIVKTITLINNLFASLTILGSGIIAVAKQMFKEFSEQGNEVFGQDAPLALSCLTLYIKNGCDSP